MSKKNIKEEEKEEEVEYIGNIWGWKFSFISLGLILVMVAFMTYRYMTLPQDVLDKNAEKARIEREIQDTMLVK